MPTKVVVDGSYGEGGGQILRTAAAFSVVTGVPVHLTNIRAGRDRPGLRPQHVSALRVLAAISGGSLKGADLGSPEVLFAPGRPREEKVRIDMGTAASITLALQAIIPAASLSGSALEVELVGGTDVPWSPTLDYLVGVVGPALASVGIRFSIEVLRRGYYPRGGGRVKCEIEGCVRPSPLELPPVSGVPAPFAASVCGALPAHVANRQKEAAESELVALGFAPGAGSAVSLDADSPGSSVLVSSIGESVFIGGDAIGAKGVRAEEVGRSAARRFVEAAASGAATDGFLADSLAPLLAFASSPSRLSVDKVTPHLETSMHVASLFTGCAYRFERLERLSMVYVEPPQAQGRDSKHNV
jgi:RNA 3'-phosphate cyclase